MKKICVLGLGYMGLPTASLFATHGHRVIGVDINPEKIKSLQAKEIPFEEPGLPELVLAAIESGNLTFQTTPTQADIYLIAVPTPIKADKSAELKYVAAAAEMIGTVIKPGALVILESTVPPGTCTAVVIPGVEKTSRLTAGKDFGVSHCPERAIPGNTLHELINNDRIIGGIDDASSQATRDLYQCFVKGSIFLTDATTAEMVKLMENTTRDINIALANEFAKIAEETGVNIWEAISLANRHPRINILSPGPGVGGHCIAVDPWFLTHQSQHAHIIRAAREINDSMPEHVMSIAKRHLDGVSRPKVAVLGVAYKPNVDDARETPAEHVLRHAKDMGWETAAHDPHVKAHEFKGLSDLEDSLKDADCIILVTHHDHYRHLDPARLRTLVRTPLLIDTRNHLPHDAWQAAGFTVVILGNGKTTRPSSEPKTVLVERMVHEAGLN